LSNLLRHDQIPSLHHGSLKIAAFNQERTSDPLDPSFVQKRDLCGHSSLSPPTFLSLGETPACIGQTTVAAYTQ